METVAIENGVTSIGNYAFYGCTNLYGFVDVNASTTENNTTVTSIGTYAFYNCDHLMMILDLDYLFSGLQTIDNYAFVECDGLTKFQHGTAPVAHLSVRDIHNVRQPYRRIKRSVGFNSAFGCPIFCPRKQPQTDTHKCRIHDFDCVILDLINDLKLGTAR
ncbi:MAG: leucine-rich repeat domain-containing protein [Prevotellaceae bacterium]|nr:leucine-rich repeat domain-containing protein [Prevotellaceae bacterium]